MASLNKKHIISSLNKRTYFLLHAIATLLNRFSCFKKNKVYDFLGLKFKNRLGLCSSCVDTDAKYCSSFASLGFSFIEIGPFSAATKMCNKRINKIIDNIKPLENRTFALSVCLTKNKNLTSDTSEIIKNYELAFSYLYDFVDMLSVDVHDFLNKDKLKEATFDFNLFSKILNSLLSLRLGYEEHKPILIKLYHRLPLEQIKLILDYSMLSGVDGIVLNCVDAHEEELRANCTELVKYINNYTKERLTIIVLANITTKEEMKSFVEAGASLIELDKNFINAGSLSAWHRINSLSKCI